MTNPQFYAKLKYRTMCGTCGTWCEVGKPAIKWQGKFHHPKCIKDVRVERKGEKPNPKQLRLF